MSQQNLFASPSISEGISAPTYETVSNLNREKVENLVNMKIHPHPLTVIIGVFVTIIVVYCFWVILLQSSPSGVWINDSDTKKYEIIHSKITGDIVIVSVDDNSELDGLLKGSVLTVGQGDTQLIGMWSTNKIYWVNPSSRCNVWTRELTIS